MSSSASIDDKHPYTSLAMSYLSPRPRRHGLRMIVRTTTCVAPSGLTARLSAANVMNMHGFALDLCKNLCGTATLGEGAVRQFADSPDS